MKNTQTTTAAPKVKPILVRLNTVEEREAFELFSVHQSRSMDKQASFIIRTALIEAGYIKPEIPHNDTQS